MAGVRVQETLVILGCKRSARLSTYYGLQSMSAWDTRLRIKER